jgi:hypothetical protein
MSTWGRLDYANSEPSFSKSRTARPSLIIATNVASNVVTSNVTLFIGDTSGIRAGMLVYGNNIVSGDVAFTGNTEQLRNFKQGFFSGNVTVTTVNPANVVISRALSANGTAGDVYRFDTPISYQANTYDVTYNANTLLVTQSRKSNTTGISNTVPHTGWVKITEGMGYIAGLSVSNVNVARIYANSFLSFSTSPVSGASGGRVANAQIVVLDGNTISVVLNDGGAKYVDIPVVTCANVEASNNSNLVFTVVPGGRLGRKQSEVLVVLSNAAALTATSGGKWFPGPTGV